MEKIFVSPEEEKIKKFNEVFDAGEELERALSSLQGPGAERLISNIKYYHRAYNSIEKMQKDRNGANFSAQDFEESDRKRKIYHDGIMDSIKGLSEINGKSEYFTDLLSMSREEIGKWALNCAEYFNLKERERTAA